MRYVVHTTDVPGSVPCIVIAKLQAGTWRVGVGVGVVPKSPRSACHR